MPTVKSGGKTKKFPYTKPGIAAAKKSAQSTGGVVIMKKATGKNGIAGSMENLPMVKPAAKKAMGKKTGKR